MPQHDLNIANQSGAAFRADLNDALAALGSFMKGPNAPPAPFACMIWVDDDTPSATVWTVKQYDGADWIELGRIDITNNVYIPSEGVIAWADVASAATVDIGAQASRSLRITGTTPINSFGTAASGVRKRLRIATGLTITHNATSLICPGAANLVLAAGDIIDVESLGSGNWVVVNYQGRPFQGIIRTAEVALTSGTLLDFTSIPADVRRITINFNGVSLNGSADLLVQLGDSGGMETTGYESGSANASYVTGGFVIRSGNAARRFRGHMILTNVSGNLWISSHSGTAAASGTPVDFHGGGTKTLSDPLTQLRLTSTSGTDTFDAGSVSLFLEQ